MRRNAVPLAVAIFAIIALIIGFVHYAPGGIAEWSKLGDITRAPSKIYARMLVVYSKPPIYQEEYRMSDIEGVSSFQYRIRGYDGKQITITAPPASVYDVSYFFGELQQDGVWALMDKSPRKNSSAQYTIYVKQVVDFKHGSRTITFTDPHYWATTTAHVYHIDLSKQKPSAIFMATGTALANPHYAKVVADFRAFGPADFRAQIARAQSGFSRK